MGSVTNETGLEFKFNVESEFRAAMIEQLQKRDLLASKPPASDDLLLDLQIAEYRPGSAFKRWVLPGWGCTVLEVKGTLAELDTKTPAALIAHERTVAVGGFYTIGAEHYILDTVAGDLASDLKIRINKGADFVVEARSRADRVVPTEPPPHAPTAWLHQVNDRRPERVCIGERKAAFGVSMGDVYFSRDVIDYMRENLELELVAAGYTLASTNAQVNLTGDVTQFWLHTRTTPLYWDVIADMGLSLSHTNQASHQTKHYSATAKKRTYVWPSAILCSQVIEKCKDSLMTQVSEDDSWQHWQTSSTPPMQTDE